MRVALLTGDHPPDDDGVAGAHAERLACGLAESADVDVHCFGPPRAELAMVEAVAGADVVHSHTRYTRLAGHLAKLLLGVPHVITVRGSEQWTPGERAALLGADRIIAVSAALREELLRRHPELNPTRVTVIRDGIDTGTGRPDDGTGELRRLGVRTEADDVRHTVVCVGGPDRRDGLVHLLRAAPRLRRGTQLVVCAEDPPSPAADGELTGLAAELRDEGCDLVWTRERPSGRALRQLLTFADVFACPSVDEPLGLVALEAMACGTPVVATAVGALLEVVEDGTTGLLVPVTTDGDGTGEPLQPEIFAKDFADRVNTLLADPDRAAAMGKAGRRRVEQEFTWASAAEHVRDVYESVRNTGSDTD